MDSLWSARNDSLSNGAFFISKPSALKFLRAEAPVHYRLRDGVPINAHDRTFDDLHSRVVVCYCECEHRDQKLSSNVSKVYLSEVETSVYYIVCVASTYFDADFHILHRFGK